MGKRELEQRFGFRVVEMPHALRDPEWVRTHPRERAEDLHLAFTDPDIKGVFASIGGDDSIRLLPYLDPRAITKDPKVFMGYSDTTMLHLAAYRAGLQTFYGPSVMAGIAENAGMFEYTERWFRKVLMTPEPVGALEPAGSGRKNGWNGQTHHWRTRGANYKSRKAGCGCRASRESRGICSAAAWTRSRRPRAHRGGRRLKCGAAPSSSGRPPKRYPSPMW